LPRILPECKYELKCTGGVEKSCVNIIESICIQMMGIEMRYTSLCNTKISLEMEASKR
jgi:hypothetical protein